jgi:hypothetical protein
MPRPLPTTSYLSRLALRRRFSPTYPATPHSVQSHTSQPGIAFASALLAVLLRPTLGLHRNKACACFVHAILGSQDCSSRRTEATPRMQPLTAPSICSCLLQWLCAKLASKPGQHKCANDSRRFHTHQIPICCMRPDAHAVIRLGHSLYTWRLHPGPYRLAETQGRRMSCFRTPGLQGRHPAYINRAKGTVES